MKHILLAIIFTLSIVFVAGCESFREYQKPQPKVQTPCAEWLKLAQK